MFIDLKARTVSLTQPYPQSISISSMKKLFGRDRTKHQKITSHRDVDAVIDDVRPKSLSFT
jgi:hypothetical protein